MADNGPNKPSKSIEFISSLFHTTISFVALFYTFETEEGSEISLTGNHYIPVYSLQEDRIVYLRASKVTVNHPLIIFNKKVKIVNITQNVRNGYYSPLTLSSNLLVNNISASAFADSHHLSPQQLHHIFAPIRGYYYLMRWMHGESFDPFQSDHSEGVHPLAAWMKYHQTKIRMMYHGIIYIFPILFVCMFFRISK